MRRFLVVLLVLCMMIASVPVALADGGDEYYYAIQNYEQLIEWMNAGYPEVFCISPNADFGWPKTETVLDFTRNGHTSGLPMYSSSLMVPENVTIKNLSLAADSKSSITINGKWYNEYYEYNGYQYSDRIEISGSITLGKNAEVTGEIRLGCGAKITANDAYVEKIYAIDYNNSSVSGNNCAYVYGTLKASQITLHKLNLNIMKDCDLTVEGVRPISGSSETTVNICNGAELTLLEKNGGISIGSNLTVMSGGKLNTIANYPRPEYTLTIDEGGEVNAYEGFGIDSHYPKSAIKGSGTIKLYGRGFPFRYENTNYESNPGNIPGVDSTIIIKTMGKCDHAGGKAIMCLPDYTDREQKTHVVRCYCCWEEMEGTQGPHDYVMTEDYDWGTRYECDCGKYEYVYKSSGSCGDEVNFNLAYNKLSITGTGETSEFSQEDAPWSSEAEKIKEIEIGESVTGIGANAFDGCTSLESVTISSDVTTVAASAFASCDSLEKVEYDGTYEQWKEMDVKEGNDAFLYAEIVFNDDTKLLAPADEYCGKTDMLLQTTEGAEGTNFSVSVIPETNEITEEEMKKVIVFLATYDDNGKMTGLEPVIKTETEGRMGFTGTMPLNNPFKMMIWADTCLPMARSVAGN